MKRIRKGDDVIVTTGKFKNQRGHVLNVLPNDRIIVENVNMTKRHIKPNPNKGETGGILQKESPIHVSNVMLYNHQTGKGDRIGFKHLEDGKKVRFYKSNGEVLET